MSLNSDQRHFDGVPEGKVPSVPLKLNGHFKTTAGGKKYAGDHILVDLYGANPVRLTDDGHIERTFRRCCDASGATMRLYESEVFEEHGGISGVAVLAESHITIHSWPEAHYAAIDIFMCGDADPLTCLSILQDAFQAETVEVEEIKRGKRVACM